MIKYRRLTLADRYQIEALVESKMSLRQIAEQLDFSAATISREIRRNNGFRGYKAKNADSLTRSRRASIGPSLKIKGAIRLHTIKHLELGWSPEQISKRLKKVSHETIYKFVYANFKYEKGRLWRFLRRHRRYRKTHKASRSFKKIGRKFDCQWIHERPAIVEERIRLGDLERDTMLGKKGGPALLVVVDRVSRLTRIRYLKNMTKEVTHLATMDIAKTLEVKTITNDNGGEFSCYKQTSKELNADIYFCRPFRSCERGTNEFTNGMIRQYFPKYEHPDPKLVEKVELLLNNRPRKCLGFKTPIEVHNEMSAVALNA